MNRAAELGHVLAIGLSTTRYRSNNYSHHEVGDTAYLLRRLKKGSES